MPAYAIWLDGVTCSGKEEDLALCNRKHPDWGVVGRNCTHAQDAAVLCDGGETTVIILHNRLLARR